MQLTLLGHSKDSLWSVDRFRAESIWLKTHWILLVMDLYPRRISGLGVQGVAVDGPALCRMFHQAIAEQLKTYYNEFRVHQSLNGATPEEKGGGSTTAAVSLEHFDWQRHCHGLFQLPIAA